MAQVIGVRNTNQAITEERLIRDVYPDISLLDPDKAPLVTLLMKLQKKKGVMTPRLEWYEDDYAARWAQNGATSVANNTNSTTITVTDGTLFVAGDMLVIPKSSGSGAPELCRVISVSSNTLTVKRDVGGIGADTIPANCAIRLAGKAFEENSSLPNAKTTAPAKKTSYLQIFRTVTNFSNTNIATEQYGAPGGDRKRVHRKKLVEHKEQLNAALLWGQASESLTGGPTSQPIRTTMGLRSVISSNITDAGGTLTRKGFEGFARNVFRYGSSKKLLLAPPILCGAFGEWATSFLNISPGETRFGVKINKIETAHGEFMLVRDWMLENGISGQSGFGGMAFAIDMDQIFYRYLSGNGESRDTKVLMDVVKDGTDGKRDEIITEAGFMIMQEKRHGMLYNITDYMA